MSAANSRESAVEDMRPDYCLIMLAFSGRRAMANPKTSFQISPVRSAADLEATVRLFNTMHLLLGSWLQDCAEELATLPVEALRIGYNEIRLDTLPTMAAAASLYKNAGLVPIAPYYETPIAGTPFLARRHESETKLHSAN
jgi:hypothetical protein